MSSRNLCTPHGPDASRSASSWPAFSALRAGLRSSWQRPSCPCSSRTARSLLAAAILRKPPETFLLVESSALDPCRLWLLLWWSAPPSLGCPLGSALRKSLWTAVESARWLTWFLKARWRHWQVWWSSWSTCSHKLRLHRCSKGAQMLLVRLYQSKLRWLVASSGYFTFDWKQQTTLARTIRVVFAWLPVWWPGLILVWFLLFVHFSAFKISLFQVSFGLEFCIAKAFPLRIRRISISLLLWCLSILRLHFESWRCRTPLQRAKTSGGTWTASVRRRAGWATLWSGACCGVFLSTVCPTACWRVGFRRLRFCSRLGDRGCFQRSSQACRWPSPWGTSSRWQSWTSMRNRHTSERRV